MKPGEFDELDEKWLADAKVGDFSTIPNPFTWDQSVKFAHIIDVASPAELSRAWQSRKTRSTASPTRTTARQAR